MPRSRRFNLATALGVALVALAMQLCIPLLHASHETVVEAAEASVEHAHDDHARSHAHDDGGCPQSSDSGHRHDGSTCPTCQQFVSLRCFVPPAAPVAAVAIFHVERFVAPAPDAPFVAHVAHSPAAPRGPPASR